MSELTARHYLYYLPDEFCIFASVPKRPEAGELAALAEKLWGTLKGIYPELEPVERPVAQVDSGDRGLLLATYRVGPKIVGDPDEAQERRQRVRQIVEELNTRQRDWAGLFPRGSVAAAMPQLLTVAAQNGYTGGGPGSGPDEVDANLTQLREFGQFSFPNNSALQRLVDEQRARAAKSSGVTVAVLDAWPSINLAGATGLLGKVAASLDADDLDAAVRPGVSYGVKQRDLPYRPMPDHGLFVAGIIADIAPAATLRPIRVLDEYCIGTAAGLFAGLARLQAIPGPLVVNLSLGFLPEDAVEHLKAEFTATDLGAQLVANARMSADMREAENHVVRAIMAVVFAALAGKEKTLIVASAGNDAAGPQNRPLPEFPARYDWGLSVAAVNSQEVASKFSNRSEDRDPPSNGIAVLGGDVAAPAVSSAPILANMLGSARKKDAVAGLYFDSTLFASGTNRAGWAYWAGTSFAAPIISGIAAVLWGKNSGLTTDAVKAKILSYGEADATGLNCKYITAVQDIQDPVLAVSPVRDQRRPASLSGATPGAGDGWARREGIMAAAFRHATLRPNGVALHVVEAGPADGPLVVLLHGFPEFWYGWRHQLGALAAAGYHVLAPDQRGYNLSDKPRGLGAYAVDRLAADVVGLIAARGYDRAAVVGHDWGGGVAWWAAIRHPSWVERLAVLNAPHPAVLLAHLRGDPAQRRRFWYVLLFQLPWLPEALLRAGGWRGASRLLEASSRPGTFGAVDLARYRAAWARPGAMAAMLDWYRALLRRRPRQPADLRVAQPTAVIWGGRDAVLRRALAAESVAWCDRGRLELLEDATHWVQHDEAARVNALILAFLAEGRPRRSASG